MSSSSTGKSVVLSIFLSVLIIGAGIYFGFPYLEDYQGSNIVVQEVSQTWDSIAIKWDNEIGMEIVN